MKIKISKLDHPLFKSNGNKPRKGIVFTCPICLLETYRKPSEIREIMFCSHKCRSKSLIKGQDKLCFVCGNPFHRSPSMTRLRGAKFCSRKCKGEFMSKNQIGHLNHQWKGGISPLNRRIRNGKNFRLWRNAVFERDNYTCQMCGIKGGYLEPHHIKAFALYPEIRFELSNGLTLCKDCHKKTDNWGYKIKKIYANKNK